MSRSTSKQETTSWGLLGASALLDRLNQVRKRKRAFGGQAVDMRAIQRRLAAERRRKRGR